MVYKKLYRAIVQELVDIDEKKELQEIYNF